MGLWSWMDEKPHKGKKAGTKPEQKSTWLVTVAQAHGLAGALFSYKEESFDERADAERFYQRMIERPQGNCTDYLIELFEVRGKRQIRRDRAMPFKLFRSNDLAQYAMLKRTNKLSRVFTK